MGPFRIWEEEKEGDGQRNKIEQRRIDGGGGQIPLADPLPVFSFLDDKAVTGDFLSGRPRRNAQA